MTAAAKMVAAVFGTMALTVLASGAAFSLTKLCLGMPLHW